jgi:hypothetical protein
MHPQYVAGHNSSKQEVEALESHAPFVRAQECQNDANSAMVRAGCTKATAKTELRQAGSFGPVRFDYIVRRQRCQRASNYWQWSALWPSLQPATQVVRKSLSWSIRNPFRSSQFIPANINSTVAGLVFPAALQGLIFSSPSGAQMPKASRR